MYFSISITKEDIEKGERGNINQCPLAKAFRRLFPTAFSVRISPHFDVQSGIWWTASIDSFNGHLSFNIPSDVRRVDINLLRNGEELGFLEMDYSQVLWVQFLLTQQIMFMYQIIVPQGLFKSFHQEVHILVSLEEMVPEMVNFRCLKASQ